MASSRQQVRDLSCDPIEVNRSVHFVDMGFEGWLLFYTILESFMKYAYSHLRDGVSYQRNRKGVIYSKRLVGIGD